GGVGVGGVGVRKNDGGGKDGAAGVARILYYVRLDSESRFNLYRSDSLNNFDETEGSECDPIVCKNVTMFKVIYMDIEGNEHSYWDSESDEFGYGTPVSVNINMEFMAGDSVHKFSTSLPMPLFRPTVK
ncbi:MAG: hypothetical protein HQK67_11410, partial [Desulfamplus sp.]|nr:hypothetical protein [Desulfamplus sp.]